MKLRPLELLDAEARIRELETRLQKNRLKRMAREHTREWAYQLQREVWKLSRLLRKRDRRIAELEKSLSEDCGDRKPLTAEDLKKMGIKFGLDKNPMRFNLQDLGKGPV